MCRSLPSGGVLPEKKRTCGPTTKRTDATARIVSVTTGNETDADRLELLDRLADRVPELDLDKHEVEWTTLDDGSEALLVDGGGIDGGSGIFFANDATICTRSGRWPRSSRATSAAS
jgi:hypothetical protein